MVSVIREMLSRAARPRLAAILTATQFACAALGVAPAPDELSEARDWAAANLGASAAEYPFSFRYGDRPSGELLRAWPAARESARLDASRTRQTITFTDPATGIAARCVAVIYDDFPTVEWILYFKNTGATPTPILSDIQALDARFHAASAPAPRLHHHVGSLCQQNDFQPLDDPIGPGETFRLASDGGRPSSRHLPYFNIEWEGRGMILAVGWPGQWAASFSNEAPAGLRVRAGQERTRLRLLPSEEIRTPLIALQFWRGDRTRSQNIWRRWMIEHNRPRPGGRPLPTHFASTSGTLKDAATEIALIDGYARENIRLDYWIMDAGWYTHPGRWFHTGTWETDTARFPRGLREVTDRARALGTKSVVWFEPERVTPGSWLWENRPQWLLGCPAESAQTPQLGAGTPSRLLDLGRADVRDWLRDHIGAIIEREGIDVYRQDFNIDPLAYWRAHDAEDRQGWTENAYVRGYLAFWDSLLREHPGLWIDTCASGGRRNDLETLRRSAPLLRSDYFTEPIGQQCHTHGLSPWLPLHGSGTGSSDPYMIRSSICPFFRIAWDTRRSELNYDFFRKMVADFRRIEPCLLGDFYPLTPYSTSNNVWMAWQFDRPEEGAGVIQAFRRAAADADSISLPLGGLDPESNYSIENLDGGAPQIASGRELSNPGLPLRLAGKPAAALLVYRRNAVDRR